MLTKLSRIATSMIVVVCLHASGAAQGGPAARNLTAAQIVAEMAVRNQQRDDALKSYVGVREYHLVYTGFPGRREAEMQVCASFVAPNAKAFSIISQSGSSFMINKVIKRLLESETEASTNEQKARTALSRENYDIELSGQETVEATPAYVLNVIPKGDNKFLYRGKIWVDANDFAVVKIEAEPAKRPSFWISKIKVHHRYTKVNDFWLPGENRSTTDVRLGGEATLTIRYSDYVVNRDAAVNSCAAMVAEKKSAGGTGQQ